MDIKIRDTYKLKSSRPAPTSVAVEQIDPQTQQVIARYDSISAAAHATGIRNIATSSKYPSTRRAGGFQ